MTFTFTGEVTTATISGDPGFTASPGDTLYGTATYDFDTPDTAPDADQGAYAPRSGLWSIEITLNGTTFSSSSTTVYFSAELYNAHPALGDCISITSLSNDPLPGGILVTGIQVNMYDNTLASLSSGDLPTDASLFSTWTHTDPPIPPRIMGQSPPSTVFEIEYKVTSTSGSGGVLYFPHADCAGDWSTEIGIVNDSASYIDVSLRTFQNDGTQNPDGKLISLAPHGSWVRNVCTTFDTPTLVNYLTLETSGKGIEGYTRFAHTAGSSGSLPLTGATTSGAFDRVDADNLMGVVFVNTSTTAATPVMLTAYSASGSVVDTASLFVGPGSKKVDFITDVFSGNLTNAVSISYSSPIPVVAFYLSLNSDYTQVDGLPGR